MGLREVGIHTRKWNVRESRINVTVGWIYSRQSDTRSSEIHVRVRYTREWDKRGSGIHVLEWDTRESGIQVRVEYTWKGDIRESVTHVIGDTRKRAILERVAYKSGWDTRKNG